MVFVLGTTLGVAALALRSPAVIATVGVLIVTVFALATFISGALNIIPLSIAILGYNLGILAGFVTMMTVQKFRSSWTTGN